MPAKEDITAPGGARAAWIAALAFGLGLLAFLCVPQPSHAIVESAPVLNLAEPDEEPLDTSADEVTCEEFEREAKEEELELEEPCEEDEEEGDNALPPPECLLRTASARVFTQTSRDQVGLVIGYTSFAPAKVTIDYRLKGGKGSLKLDSTTQRFSKQGVVRLIEKLKESQMAKVLAAQSFDVRLRVSAAPGYCNSYFVKHLTSKRKAHGQLVWVQPKSGSASG